MLYDSVSFKSILVEVALWPAQQIEISNQQLTYMQRKSKSKPF